MKYPFNPCSRTVTEPKANHPTYLDRLARYGITGAHPGGLSLTRRLLANEKLTADTALLDVGCGVGQTSAYIGLHYPCKIAAVDLNPEMVAQARRKFAQHQLKIESYQADASKLPFSKATFDLVLSESVTIFTAIETTLREYCRVLKPGGGLLAIELTATNPLTDTELAAVQQTLGIKQVPTLELWQQMLMRAGFTKVQVLTQSRINPLGLGFHLINRCFKDYCQLLLKYHHKLQYAVYRCQK